MNVEFEWDQANIGHIARHKMTPQEVEDIFENDPIMIDFDVVDGEERWTVIGHTAAPRFILVVLKHAK